MKPNMTKKQSRTLIFMCWALYVAAYLGRYSYNANKLPMALFYGISSDTEMGVISSLFFFAYGIGQIFNGIFCKRYSLKYVLPLSLFGSAIINFFIYLDIFPFEALKYLWLLNGVFQSVLWSSLLLTLARNLDGEDIKKSIVAMSTTASVGTLLVYGLSAALATFGGFKYSFLFGAVMMTAAALGWLFSYDKMTVYVPEIKQDVVVQEECKGSADRFVFHTLILFGFFAIVINFLKDGLATWVPEILYDTYQLHESLSILLTLIVPILTIFGTTFVVLLNKKIKDHAAIICILFSISSVLIGIVVCLFSTPLYGLVLIAFGLISLLMGGANNVVTSILPLSLKDKANTGFIAGILNGCCYVGSTASSVGLGALSDYYSAWLPVCYFLLGANVLAAVVAFIATLFRKRKKAE